jgi:hypothetical protein
MWSKRVAWLVILAVVLCGCQPESKPAEPEASAPCVMSNSHKIAPYNADGAPYAGRAPHLATLIKSDYRPEALNSYALSAGTGSPRLPAKWEPPLRADGSIVVRARQDGDHGPTYAAAVQLVVCEYLVSVGSVLQQKCGQYGALNETGGIPLMLYIRPARYRYEVRESRTGELRGAFELNSGNSEGETVPEGVCPDVVGKVDGYYPDVPDTVTDATLATALKPYVLTLRR